MAATTIRLERSTAELLRKLGRKGETYDQIIRRLAKVDLILELEERADSDDFIPASEVPWDKLDEIDVDEL